MSAEVECLHIRFTEVIFAANFNLTHLEFVSNGSTRNTEVGLIKLLNINHDKRSQTLSSSDVLEVVLPIVDCINFVSAHSMDI